MADAKTIETKPGYVDVTVRYPPAGLVGWALRRTEDEARQKALDRLNYERLLRKPV
jgi:hypothetical protein